VFVSFKVKLYTVQCKVLGSVGIGGGFEGVPDPGVVGLPGFVGVTGLVDGAGVVTPLSENGM